MNPLNPPNPRLKNDLCNSCNLRSNHPAQSMNAIGGVPDSGMHQRQAPCSSWNLCGYSPHPLKMSVTHPPWSAVPRSAVRSTTEHGPQYHGARPVVPRSAARNVKGPASASFLPLACGGRPPASPPGLRVFVFPIPHCRPFLLNLTKKSHNLKIIQANSPFLSPATWGNPRQSRSKSPFRP